MKTMPVVDTKGMPPYTINGKLNPEYNAEYQRRRRAAHPTLARAENLRYKRLAHERRNMLYRSQCRCVVCGLVFDREAAKLAGFRFFQRKGPMKGVCAECKVDE